MLDHELKRVGACLRGLCHFLPTKHPNYGMGGRAVVLRHDRERERDNKKQPRAMACASVSRSGDPTIGICTNLASLPDEFLAGILLHELTHLAFGLMGEEASEVDVDATVTELVPEADYRYGDVVYRDRVTGKERHARNLEKVDPQFAGYCTGWWSNQCRDGRVVVR